MNNPKRDRPAKEGTWRDEFKKCPCIAQSTAVSTGKRHSSTRDDLRREGDTWSHKNTRQITVVFDKYVVFDIYYTFTHTIRDFTAPKSSNPCRES